MSSRGLSSVHASLVSLCLSCQTGLGPSLTDLLNLITPLKFCSKYSHMLRSWGLGSQAMNPGDTTRHVQAPQKGSPTKRGWATQQAEARAEARVALLREPPSLKDSLHSALQGIPLEGGLGSYICQSCKSLKP